MIISGPNINSSLRGKISNEFVYVKDIAPTILQLTGTKSPEKQYNGKNIEPITGKSIVSITEGKINKIHDNNESIGYEIGGNAALFMGKYKILFNRPPLGDGEWYLYNIAKDPGETNNLKKTHPDIFATLMQAYQTYVEENGVLPIPTDYDQRKQVIKNAIHQRLIKPILDFWKELF